MQARKLRVAANDEIQSRKQINRRRRKRKIQKYEMKCNKEGGKERKGEEEETKQTKKEGKDNKGRKSRRGNMLKE